MRRMLHRLNEKFWASNDLLLTIGWYVAIITICIIVEYLRG